ncbi:NAD(P)H-binding protein [Rhodonellum sp.]|uniref:NAD(P)H-binding protein n=1 Tax=Rhodonellum sp. TaxID=2231180 RepID=UPI00271789A1|nr:NAD(P)H-binding protein [Rhodonellum sp.]MDO9552269.1 NAD(P)H-binding protein [Rhodonellum sp.]
MKKISVIGLGWLGEPLAKQLIKKGYHVMGSTTSPEKQERFEKQGIPSALLSFVPYPEGVDFHPLFETDLLIVNIPPRSRTFPESFHPEQIKYIKAMATQAGIKKIIYVSSTSVYPDANQEVRESDPLTLENTGNKALFNAEQLLWQDKNYDLTIIRFGGLLGVDRIPGRYFSGKENVVGDSQVNYIHRDDAVNLIDWVIEKSLWNETFNGVCPIHPQRREIYEKNALDLGMPPPSSYAAEGTSKWKVISPQKIQDTGLAFKIPNPLDFWYVG